MTGALTFGQQATIEFDIRDLDVTNTGGGNLKISYRFQLISQTAHLFRMQVLNSEVLAIFVNLLTIDQVELILI